MNKRKKKQRNRVLTIILIVASIIVASISCWFIVRDAQSINKLFERNVQFYNDYVKVNQG